jgi:hypothetical protein
MGFACLGYNVAAAAAGATLTDLTAAVDADFSQRNGHYIFTEQYRLWGLCSLGASLTAAALKSPTINAIGLFQPFSANLSLTPPSNTQIDVYEPYMPPLPMMEEVQVQFSNNLGSGTEKENALLYLVTSDWTKNLPQGRMPILAQATFTVTPTANAWSGPNVISFTQSLRGGVYAVVGAELQGGNAAWFRIIFSRYKLYNGRKLRPGGVVQHAYADVITAQRWPWSMNMGEWGRFHTFELPQIEVFGTAASSTTYTATLFMIYLGESDALLQQGLGGGGIGGP